MMTTELEEVAEETLRQLVTFRIQSQVYAVPIESVVEMTLLQDLEPIIGAPSWIRGMMQLRDSVIPVLDLRLRLGMTDLSEETNDLEAQLEEQKKDHITWLQTLEECCATGARFDLQQDPKQCAFGLWLCAFCTEDAVLANQIAKFAEPHARLHALAGDCLGLVARGKKEEAQAAIDLAREVDLSEMIHLFEKAVRDIKTRSRQMVVILSGDTENLGLAVDRVDSVTTVNSDQIDRRPLHELDQDESNDQLLVASVVRPEDESSLIQILDIDRIFASAGVGYTALDADDADDADDANSVIRTDPELGSEISLG